VERAEPGRYRLRGGNGVPWEHCGDEVPDDRACERCGVSKSEWTVHFEKTVTLRLGGPKRAVEAPRTFFLELELVDPRGEPVRGEVAVALQPAMGEARNLTVKGGRARVEALPPGESQVRFPGLPGVRAAGSVESAPMDGFVGKGDATLRFIVPDPALVAAVWEGLLAAPPPSRPPAPAAPTVIEPLLVSAVWEGVAASAPTAPPRRAVVPVGPTAEPTLTSARWERP
jgi:hypothetical protein